MTGDGAVVLATPDGPHADLFYGLPNSYGTLGYAVRLKIELARVKPYVRLEHRRFAGAAEVAEAIGRLAEQPIDFLDGVAFSPEEIYLTIGKMTDQVPYTSDYTGQEIYYRSIASRPEDFLTIHDYIWRWDTDWFWCSRTFGVQNPVVRRLWPDRYKRSDVYWKLVALDARYGIAGKMDVVRRRPRQERVIQDVEVPLEGLAEVLGFLDRLTGQRPVWLCPVRARDRATVWPLYPLDPRALYVNVGFWGTAPLPAAGGTQGFNNRAIELKVAELGGMKSLYSTSFYDRETFDRLYGGESFHVLKKTYDPDSRLLDLYEKTVRAR